MLYWSGFTDTQWDSLTESGWYYLDIDRYPAFSGTIYGSPRYEEFSNYLPASALFQNSIYDYVNVGSGYAVIAGVVRNNNDRVGYLYKDSGTGYYSGVFTHEFSFINVLPVNTYGLVDVWAVSNTVANEYSWQLNSSQAARLALNNGRLSLRSHQNASNYNSTYSIASGVPYHVRMVRNGTSLISSLYDNPVYSGTALETLSVTLPSSSGSYRYFFPFNKPNYGSTNIGQASFVGYNYNLYDRGWEGVMDPLIGFNASFDGTSTFSGLLYMMLGLDGAFSGLAVFTANMSVGFASGLDLYINGKYAVTDYIPLFISGQYDTVAGSIPLYIGASGEYGTLYLYTKGYGNTIGYRPVSDAIPLFIGSPDSTYLHGSLPLYLEAADGSLASGLHLYINGSTQFGSGILLYTSGVGDLTNYMKLYTHGY